MGEEAARAASARERSRASMCSAESSASNGSSADCGGGATCSGLASTSIAAADATETQQPARRRSRPSCYKSYVAQKHTLRSGSIRFTL